MIEEIINIAVKAGDIILNIREEGFQERTKNDSFDFVTSADLESEKFIVQSLLKKFPNHSILSEERDKIEKKSSFVWMVDPLDGTKDFKNGGDGFSVMVGLCQKGKPLLGVVYAPAKKVLYFAQKNKGAYERIGNKDYKLQVSKTKNLIDSKMITRISHGEKREGDKLIDYFSVKKKIPESSGGIKLGLIARGDADFHINTNFRARKWDVCAPQIILEEAGGSVTDFKGNALDYNASDDFWSAYFIASNKLLHTNIVNKVKKYYEDNKK